MRVKSSGSGSEPHLTSGFIKPNKPDPTLIQTPQSNLYPLFSKTNRYPADSGDNRVLPGENAGEGKSLLHKDLQKILNIKSRLTACGTDAWITITCANPDCRHIQIIKTKTHCFLRYGRCCFESRYVKAKNRLLNYKPLPKRIIHAVIGFPLKPEFHRQYKRFEEWLMSEFSKRLKKLGIELAGLRIFDFQNKESEYTHYHLALIPVKTSYGRLTDRECLDKILPIAKEYGLIFHIEGYRNWNKNSRCLNYFAKRIAGMYGDSPNTFFLSDKMDLERYVDNFYNIRSLVKLSRRLSCNIVPVSFKCEVCGCDRYYVRIDFEENVSIFETKLTDFIHT